ncbi:FAD-dependent oxidoreductase [Flammeovirgaceae bacterium SG7u.111]|nr:FAD-dependent oxidoreductase [Flammeovirgaceae bacterium SG7u.132]WPO35409.1 FAD-dependent oxidoreductase [Flammeovirgaceae bacterium SG7u.111]
MKKPYIFAVDDDPQVLQAIQRDLRKEYRKDFRILATASANEGLEALKDLKNKGEDIALFVSDQRMPEMYGVDFLEKAKKIYPEAKRVLLTAYSDIDAAIKAINDVQLDYYLMKPWTPPEERLFPVLNDLIDDWQSGHIPSFHGIKVVGHQWSPQSHTIKDFLSGNMIPYQWIDILSNNKGKELLQLNELDDTRLPIIFFEDGSYLVQPKLAELANKIGLKTEAKQALYDVAIIGAGPSGLAAGVYGGSEGLNTILIEKRAPGGQAGTSSRIENYLGFPKGLSGSDLARRAITQATRFGVEFLSPQEVDRIELLNQYKTIHLKDGSSINTKSILISTGVDYRKHPAKGIEKFTGAGVYYGAANTEAHACKNQEIFIVGGGNSAGQAAVYLSRFAKNVYIVIRRPDLTSSMSSYLIDQINEVPNIHLLSKTNLMEVKGDEQLNSVVLEHVETNEITEKNASALFIFIGARPYTHWLPKEIMLNNKGFVETGHSLKQHGEFKKTWKLERDPSLLETSIPGIFASGDVRAGAMNRVASAVGEGSMAIKFIHEYLAEN